MADVSISFELDNMKDLLASPLTDDEQEILAKWTLSTWTRDFGANATEDTAVNVVAEVFGVIAVKSFSTETSVPVFDYDVNNRFQLVPDGAGGMQLLHAYRASKDAEFETPQEMVRLSGRLYAFPVLNDYGVDDLFLSVVVLDA